MSTNPISRHHIYGFAILTAVYITYKGFRYFSSVKAISDEGSRKGVSDEDYLNDDHIKFSVEPRYFHEVYKVGKQLGAGAYSCVYKAQRLDDPSKEFAVKITKRKTITAEIERTIRSEVAILQSLDHPHVVRYIEHFEEANHWFVVLELLKGGELFDRIVTKTKYDEKQARDLVLILLDAIKYLHDRNIVHRDLKLENLLLQSVDDDAAVKVADFGFAKEEAPGGLSTQCGSAIYVAPEILLKIAYGKPVDMWAVGVITFILLGGYPPFQDEDGKQSVLFSKITSGSFTFDTEFWGHVSEEAKDLISSLLVVDPAKRLTVDDSLRHAWIRRSSSDLSAVDLNVNLKRLKGLRGKRKFKAAAAALIAISKMSTMASNSRQGSPVAPVARKRMSISESTLPSSFSLSATPDLDPLASSSSSSASPAPYCTTPTPSPALYLTSPSPAAVSLMSPGPIGLATVSPVTEHMNREEGHM